MAFFCLQVLSWEAVSAQQLAPSIRKVAHREIRHNSVADCREFGRELAGNNLPRSLFLCVSFPFSILNNGLIVKRDDSLLDISSATLWGGSEKRTTSFPPSLTESQIPSFPVAPMERDEEGKRMQLGPPHTARSSLSL